VYLWRLLQNPVKKPLTNNNYRRKKHKENRKTPPMRGRKTPLPQRGPATHQTLRFPGMIFRI
jgi:hypothetical protein